MSLQTKFQSFSRTCVLLLPRLLSGRVELSYLALMAAAVMVAVATMMTMMTKIIEVTTPQQRQHNSRTSAGISGKRPFSPHGERHGLDEIEEANGNQPRVYWKGRVYCAVNSVT